MCRLVGFVAVVLSLAGCGGESPLEMLMMRPESVIQHTPADWGYDYQEMSVPVAEGRSVVIWHVPSKTSKALVVVIPGCTDNKGWYLRALPVLVPGGYDTVLLDYEGFGNSPGIRSLQHTVDDALAVTEFVQMLHPKVVLFGASLGAPLAARAGAEYDVAGLILEGSLILDQEPSLWLEQNRLAFPPLVAIATMFTQSQLPEGYDILKYITLAKEPKLILHSSEDTIVPFVSGQMVYDAAAEPKTFWQERGDHGKMIGIDPESYTQTIIGWLDKTVVQ